MHVQQMHDWDQAEKPVIELEAGTATFPSWLCFSRHI